MEISVTRHGEKRMRKRVGLSKHSVSRMAEMVYEKGIRFCDTRGRIHRYLEEVSGRGEPDNELVVHGNNLYIYRDSCLITVWPLPGKVLAS